MNLRSLARVTAGGTPSSGGGEVVIVEGVVKAVTAAGMTFTLPYLDGGRTAFGPCPWPKSRTEPAGTGPHDHTETVPPAGSRCLVALGVPGPGSGDADRGGGVQNPWVIQVWF